MHREHYQCVAEVSISGVTGEVEWLILFFSLSCHFHVFFHKKNTTDLGKQLLYCLLYRYSIFLILSGAQCVLSMYCYFMKLVCIIKRSKTWVSTLLSIDFWPSSWWNGFPRWCSLRKRKNYKKKTMALKSEKYLKSKFL